MIQVSNVTKVYGPTRALDQVSFEVGNQQIDRKSEEKGKSVD